MAQLPRPGQGDKVWFWRTYPASGDPLVGTVVRNGQNAQFILVHTRSGPVYYDGVHWLHDEAFPKQSEWWTSGAWDFHPETSFMRDTLTVLEQLSARISALEAKATPPELPSSGDNRSEEEKQAAKDRMAKARAARKVKV